MSWMWSHTAKAYRDAELNLQDLPPDTLREIWAEWKAARPTLGEPDFDEDAYAVALNDAQPLGPVRLASDIWDWASELATCDSGGWNAWLCPWGCGPHCVPFDREGPEDE